MTKTTREPKSHSKTDSLRNEKGGALLFVMIALVALVGLYQLMPSHVQSLYTQVFTSRSYVNERLALNSLIDYVILGVKQHKCFSSNLVSPAPSCDLNTPNSVDALLLNSDSISFLQFAHSLDNNVQAPPNPVPTSMTFSGSLTSLGGSGSPLQFVSSLFNNTNVQNFQVTITRIIDPQLPNTGNQIYLSIDAKLLDATNTLVVMNGKKLEIESLLTLYPREMGTFALVVPHDLYLGGLKQGSGDIVFPAGSGTGVVFESPVFVNHNVHLVGQAPVTFADRLFVGSGSVMSANTPFAPQQTGSTSTSFWSQIPGYSGFQDGIQIDGYDDPGLDVFSGNSASTTTAASYSQCTSISQMFYDPTGSAKSQLALTQYAASSSSSFSFQMGLTGANGGTIGPDVLNPQFNRLAKHPSYSGVGPQVEVTNDASTGAFATVQLDLQNSSGSSVLTSNKLPTGDLAFPTSSSANQTGNDGATSFKVSISSSDLNTFQKMGNAISNYSAIVCANMSSDPNCISFNKVMGPLEAQLTQIESASTTTISISPTPAQAQYTWQNAANIAVSVSGGSTLYDTSTLASFFNAHMIDTTDSPAGALQKLGQIGSAVATPPLLNPVLNISAYDVSYSGGASGLPSHSSQAASGMTASSRLSNLSGQISFSNSSSGLSVLAASALGSSAQVASNLPSIIQQCLNLAQPPSGAASWTATDFSNQTIFSWNVGGTGQSPVAGTNFSQPVIAELDFTNTNSNSNIATSPNSVQFQVGSIVDLCRIKASANFVTGFFVCNTLQIDARTTPLRMIATFIANGITIDPSAYASGITWSSIYFPNATYELQNTKVLTPKFPSAAGNSCQNQLGANTPIWSPYPAFTDVSNLYSCNPLSLRAEGANFQWTAMDPDCGLQTGQIVTTCKHHVLNYLMVEQARAGGI